MSIPELSLPATSFKDRDLLARDRMVIESPLSNHFTGETGTPAGGKPSKSLEPYTESGKSQVFLTLRR